MYLVPARANSQAPLAGYVATGPLGAFPSGAFRLAMARHQESRRSPVFHIDELYPRFGLADPCRGADRRITPGS